MTFFIFKELSFAKFEWTFSRDEGSLVFHVDPVLLEGASVAQCEETASDTSGMMEWLKLRACIGFYGLGKILTIIGFIVWDMDRASAAGTVMKKNTCTT